MALALGFASASADAQARQATAVRLADIQVGAGYSGADPDYSPQHFFGLYVYATVDFSHHYGIELTMHRLNTTDPSTQIYEHTYEIGPRYVRRYGRFSPYVKGMVGRGVFNFPKSSANLAYNLYGFGGGVDTAITEHISARAEYEYQRWASFPPRGLQPNIVSAGVAYHF